MYLEINKNNDNILIQFFIYLLAEHNSQWSITASTNTTAVRQKKVYLYQAVKAHRLVRRRGSHIFFRQ
jgi:hypothetical protein